MQATRRMYKTMPTRCFWGRLRGYLAFSLYCHLSAYCYFFFREWEYCYLKPSNTRVVVDSALLFSVTWITDFLIKGKFYIRFLQSIAAITVYCICLFMNKLIFEDYQFLLIFKDYQFSIIKVISKIKIKFLRQVDICFSILI